MARESGVLVAGKGTFCKGTQRELFVVMKMFNSLIVMVAPWVCTFSKSHQITHSEWSIHQDPGSGKLMKTLSLSFIFCI